MTTVRNTSDHHWSDILRFLAPGPIVLGMHSCIEPAVWRATWQALATGRHVAQTPAEDPAEDEVLDKGYARVSVSEGGLEPPRPNTGTSTSS